MSTTRRQKPDERSPIHQTSSPSVSIFWLDQEKVRTCLAQAITRLATTHPEIEEVWLFGSLARGDAVPGSDADLLIVLRDSQVPFLDRSARYQPDFCGLGVDVLAYTRAELASLAAEGRFLLQQAKAEGMSLFRRSDHPEQYNESRDGSE
jgi:uncharacterized protein